MSYLDEFADFPQSLFFNKGETGVVENCKITIEKKEDGGNERAPEYKVVVFDAEQVANNNDETTIYPVNKGYFYKSEFKSKAAERYAANELKHLLKTFDHPESTEGKLLLEKEINNYNEFLDYTMAYIKKSLSNNPIKRYDVVVSYGSLGYEKKFLQLEGNPWYIGKTGSKLALKDNAITERPKPDNEDNNQGNNASDDDEESPWV